MIRLRRDTSVSAGSAKQWVIEPRPALFHLRLVEVWNNRKMLAYFCRTALDRLTHRTLLGDLWLIIRPSMIILPNLLFFMLIMKVDSGDLPYPLFFLAGYIPWLAFDQSMMWCTRSLEINRSIIRKMYFPRLLLPIAFCVPGVIFSGIALIIYVLTLGGFYLKDGTFYFSVTWNFLWLPVAMLQVYIIGLGVGLWTSVWGARYRDVRFSLRYITGLWFMITPVAYAHEAVSGWISWLVWLNPVTYPVDLVRVALLGGSPHGTGWASAGITLLLLIGGLWYFIRSDAETVDKI